MSIETIFQECKDHGIEISLGTMSWRSTKRYIVCLNWTSPRGTEVKVKAEGDDIVNIFEEAWGELVSVSREGFQMPTQLLSAPVVDDEIPF